ncbi:hypothetical protein [Xylophilus sp. ASV27]|uniref:hypothetical protein n=1 Tax=Xylophilus sp. ASV27 TaxID=2795129 RepID=UPI0018EA7036|nr:hypothetical protein [Xylophilus sp. ASV27]
MDKSGRTPSLFSQHLPVRPSEDAPYFGRDPMDRTCAIFTIVEALQQLDLGRHAVRLLLWLGRFEGLEKHLEEEHDPVLCVRQILLQHVADRPLGVPGDEKTWHSIVRAIMGQQFIHTCSDWSGPDLRPRVRWNPQRQSFLEFLAEGLPGEDMATWSPDRGNLELSLQCAEHLLGQRAA